MPAKHLERMQCMEVWGGNQPVDRDLRTTGLDVRMFSRPHANSLSGGDVYYVSSCASGRITRLLLADVSGHGEAVADRAEILRELMRRNINYIDHASLVSAINHEFADASTHGAFATALIGTFFAPTRTLTLSNAGHPNPFVFRAKTGAWRQLTTIDEESAGERNFPLGIEVEQNFSGMRTKLRPGDLVLCFTDGLTELERSDGKMLGFDGLLEIISQLDPHDPARLIDRLLERVAPSNHAINESDDVSILLFQLNDARVSLRDNLLAPFRVAASVFDRRRNDATAK